MGGTRALDGRAVSFTDTAWLVARSDDDPSDPRPTVWSGERLFIPRAAVTRLERRVLDRPRTLRAVGLYSVGMLVAGAVWLSAKGLVSGSPGGGTGPPNP